VSFHSDQFSFGSMLYEMATGKRPFQRATGAQTLAAIIQDEPEPVAQINPRAPAPLRWIVERCLAKDPEERYASTRDLARDLKSVRDHIGEVTSTASGGAGVVEVAARRRRSLALPIAAAAVTLAVFGALWAGKRMGAGRQPKFQRLTFQRGTVNSARFGPDGTTVYYAAAWEGEAPRIFSLRPGIPDSSPLPLPNAALLAMSPAGEMAVLLEPNYAVLNFALYGTLARVSLSGTAPKEVLKDVSFADWAPGGSELAVVHRVGGKERLEYPIGKVLYETAGWIQHPRFARDGRRIAFIDHSFSGDDGAIAIVDLSGRKTDLSGGWATVQGLAWSPEGGEIWFTAARVGVERELFGVTPSGKLRQIRTLRGTPALLDVQSGGIALITEDVYRGSSIAFTPAHPSGRDLGWFDWGNGRSLSVDGKWLLFDESGEGGGAAGSVYVRSTDGAPAVRLGDGLAMGLSPDASLALTRRDAAPARFAIVPVKAGQTRDLPPDGLGRANYGEFFPDGRRFAFEAYAPGHGARLYVQDLAGGSARAVSDEGIGPSDISISPDGAWIAAIGPDTRVWLYPPAGGAPRELASSRPGDYPSGWTADGAGLYVSRVGFPCPVDAIDIATGTRTHIRDLSGADEAGITQLGPALVTPDARTMVITANRILSTLYKVTDLR
jgi:eukaryotic-like serine/threonine-protein kinase